mgnify:FL=1
MTERVQPGSTFSDLMTYLRANGLPEEEIKQIIPPEMYEAPKDK